MLKQVQQDRSSFFVPQIFTKLFHKDSLRFLPRITRINSNFLVFFLATDAQIFLIRLICDNLWQKNLFLICLCGAKQSKITLNTHFFVNLNLFQILYCIFLLDAETSSARQEFIFLTTNIYKGFYATNYHELPRMKGLKCLFVDLLIRLSWWSGYLLIC
jgi:hypothetical protein